MTNERSLKEKRKSGLNEYTTHRPHVDSRAGLACRSRMNMYAVNSSYAYLGYPTLAKPKTLN